MSDLMITINSSASKRNGFLIIETYYTKKVDSNKSGKFKGGVISSADIYSNMPIENCSLGDVAALFKEECHLTLGALSRPTHHYASTILALIFSSISFSASKFFRPITLALVPVNVPTRDSEQNTTS